MPSPPIRNSSSPQTRIWVPEDPEPGRPGPPRRHQGSLLRQDPGHPAEGGWCKLISPVICWMAGRDGRGCICWAPSPAWLRRRAAASWNSTPTSFCAASMTAIFQDSDPVAHEVAQARPDLLLRLPGRPSRRSGSPARPAHWGQAGHRAGALWMCSPATERAPEQWQKLGMEWGLPPAVEGAQAHRPHGQAASGGPGQGPYRRASGRGKQRVL